MGLFSVSRFCIEREISVETREKEAVSMCTAVTYHTKDHYFGRNLDFAFSYGESVTITPRKFPFSFPDGTTWERHYAIIGMAHISQGYPLYYDAVNEKGLAMAGLLFAENAVYQKPREGGDNIPTWAFLPWILGQCATVAEAKALLERIHLTDTPFSEAMPPAPLHWMIADGERSITVEAVEEGLRIYENPVGVLTNNPPFPFHLQNLSQYLNLTAEPAANQFSTEIDLRPFSHGFGAFGLPGDLSSASRFIRAAFVKLHSVSGEGEKESVSQFFHILAAVEQQRGCVHLGEGRYEITHYTSCCNLEKGIYYYKTYDTYSIQAVELGKEDLEGSRLVAYPLQEKDCE